MKDHRHLNQSQPTFKSSQAGTKKSKGPNEIKPLAEPTLPASNQDDHHHHQPVRKPTKERSERHNQVKPNKEGKARKDKSKLDTLRDDMGDANLTTPKPTNEAKQALKEGKKDGKKRKNKKRKKERGYLTDQSSAKRRKASDQAETLSEPAATSSTHQSPSSSRPSDLEQSSAPHTRPSWEPTRVNKQNPFNANAPPRPTSRGPPPSALPISFDPYFDPSLFPTDYDFGALSDHLGKFKSASAPNADSDALASAVQAYSSSSTYKPPPPVQATNLRREPRSRTESSSRSERRPKTLEEKRQAVVEEARGKSDYDLLVNRAYSSTHLKWLSEDLGLSYKRGHFSKLEDEQLMQGLDSFKLKHGLSSDAIDRLLHERKSQDAELHEELFKSLAAKLGNRPNIAVRVHFKSLMHPASKKGPWKPEDDELLRSAVAEVGSDWVLIGKRVDRLAQDCRSRWQLIKKGPSNPKRHKWTDEEVEALKRVVEDVKDLSTRSKVDDVAHSEDLSLPWTLISERLGGKRTPQTCSQKWEQLQAESNRLGRSSGVEGSSNQPTWDPAKDYAIFLSRMKAQDQEDEGSIKFRKLSDERWNWSKHFLRKKLWKMKQKLPDDWKGDWRSTLTELSRIFAPELVAGTASEGSGDKGVKVNVSTQ
ncbi:hypothetical protein IE53DRAFT_384481 [Violaceomyces palustris]|uniref:Uncharacterized protein n=1 Tax=Violaceomyces palustris TaxID=1673888 RepID=A0ACD0P4L8_9BASI|nr:hypothetical protein IE53DRAFT_384481 [Violaceomyces palustris]